MGTAIPLKVYRPVSAAVGVAEFTLSDQHPASTIPALPASIITSGTFAIARMPLGGAWVLTSDLSISGGLVGINTAAPDRRLDVLDAVNPQLRLTHTDGSVYSDVQADGSGDTIITNTGTKLKAIDKRLMLAAAHQVVAGTTTMALTVETGFAEIALAPGEQVGGAINVYAIADDGSAIETVARSAVFAAINSGGTVTAEARDTPAVPAHASNGSGVVTVAITAVAGAGKVTLKADVGSTDLAVATVTLRYELVVLAANAITTL